MDPSGMNWRKMGSFLGSVQLILLKMYGLNKVLVRQKWGPY